MLLSYLIRTYNEEANLPRALYNYLQFADEVVISDGGSTDASRQVALSYGPKVKWVDYPGGSICTAVHFNHAGLQFDFGLTFCQGDWVMVSDVDEVVCEYLTVQLHDILRSTDCDAFRMWGCHVVQDNFHYAADCGTGPGLIRLFRNKPGISFPAQAEHACHMELQKWNNIGLLKGATFHYGYLTPEMEAKKANLRAQALPDDPTYQDLARHGPKPHTPRPIPWERCAPNCKECWMAEM